MLADLIPLLVAGGAGGGAGLVAWAIYQRLYKPVPPNRAMVLFGHGPRSDSDGRSSGPSVVERSPKILVGGGAVLLPWNDAVGYLSLAPIEAEATVRALHTFEAGRAAGWEVTVAVQVKIPIEPEGLRLAAESLLGKSDEEIRTLVRRAVEGATPAVLARLPLGGSEPDWERLAVEIEASVAPDLVGWGLVVRAVGVKELRRIAPPGDSDRGAEPRRRAALPAAARDPDAEGHELESRLSRIERSVGVIGAEVTRLLREPPAPVFEPVSVYELTPRPAPLEAGAGPSYDPNGGGRPPRPTRPGPAEPSEGNPGRARSRSGLEEER